jgi:hypothetical protein
MKSNTRLTVQEQFAALPMTEPSARGERLTLLVTCPECERYYTHEVFENTLRNNLIGGSARTPLRRRCCGTHYRLNSKTRESHIRAECPSNKHHEVSALKDVAEASNMALASGEKVTTNSQWQMYNVSNGYAAKGAPKPWKRWHNRGGV